MKQRGAKHIWVGCAALLLCWVWFYPVRVFATAQDEDTMARVGTKLQDLLEFSYADRASNPTFYTLFADKVQKAGQQIDAANTVLGRTHEAGRAKAAVMNIRTDLRYITTNLNTWHTAAVASDATAFDTARSTISQDIEMYNQDISAYALAAYGGKATSTIIVYAVLSSVAFMLTAWLFAWAVYRNTPSRDDLVQEIYRRLRWRRAYGSCIILIGILLPAGIFFFTASTPPPFLWTLSAAGTLFELFAMVQLYRVNGLKRRTP